MTGFSEDKDLPDSWAISVTDRLERSTRRAWAVATVASVIALLLAISIALMVPLKTVEPYTILVDRQTGHVEALWPLEEGQIEPDTALTRSMLVQYVTARESFSQDTVQDNFRKVNLWSDPNVSQQYTQQVDANNPESPLSYLPPRSLIRTEIKSVSSLRSGQTMVRFLTQRADPNGNAQEAQHWVAVIGFGFTDAQMSEEDRYLNPLGFQVTSYRRNAETLPEAGIINGVEQSVGEEGGA